MFQLRIHGRGGQGVVTAAELVSVAAFIEGRHAQAFPSFGSERTGAPVVAFCRIDDKEIRVREPIAEPDALILQDPTLLHQVDVFGGLGPDGYILINSARSFEELGLGDFADRFRRDRLRTVPATDLAREHLGRPIPNAVLVGGFAALSGLISLESVAAAIRAKFAAKLGDNRAQLDEAVGINSVERFLGDQAIEQGWTMQAAAPPSGKRVLVVGAGPSGLSAAYHLTRLGHDVTIHEAGPMAGGMMRFGIPKYRLPREVLDAEVERILAMGVRLELDTKVTNIEQSLREGGFDAAFLAVGAHISKRAYIPAGESGHILDALSVLRSMEGQERPMLGRRVVVYGGGNTAMDVARTARRLGAEEAIVVYRRTRERMPAHDFEVEEAEQEGVMMRWLSTIKQANEGKLVIEKMELDQTGFPQPTGELEELEADSVVLALGQDTDLSLLEGIAGIDVEEGVVEVGPNMMTGHEGIFAGGDMVPDERTVTVGIGHGKKAARHIDGWLRGKPYEPRPKPEVVTFDMLNTWYYADAPRTVQPQLDPIRRQGTFDEVVHGLDESNALFEARRCLSCGNCFSCDNCYGVCPDNAVLKLAGTASANVNGYAIDLDYCKGCGMCVSECPCGAITMEPEDI